jgi:FMN-dependent NADH-azoreductase
MSNLLFVTSSLFGENSKSRQAALDLVQRLQSADPTLHVRTRETTAIPHLTGATLGALMTPADQRSEQQKAAVAFADSLIEEIEAADTIVIAAPMYNFAIPSTLKAWIDHIARSGRTFRYSANGPEGLLKNKRVFVVTGRGGVYSEGPARAMDFQEPYLRGMLAFLGLADVTFVHVEGLNISPEAAAQGVNKARAHVARLTPDVRAAA